MNNQSNISRKRARKMFFIISMLILALIIRLGYIQVLANEKYNKMAVETQTRDDLIPAKRGIIYDRNRKELAISAGTSTIWVEPKNVDVDKISLSAQVLAPLIGKSEEEIKDAFAKDATIVKLAKWIEKTQTDLIRDAKIKGISIREDVKRHYPFGNFAAHIIGGTTDDNVGLAGIEQRYDRILTGISGRWIKSTDAGGRQLAFGKEKYFGAENGLNVVLTIDEAIQHFLEKSARKAMTETKAVRVMTVMMDIKTGDILGMTSVPDFDPNNPRIPLDEKEAAFVATLSDDKKMEYWNKMWRNPLISDTYEPGSTFKLVTAAIALEESVTTPNDGFKCTGYFTVADRTLRCWRYYNPHGHESLSEAIANSCNPVFIQLGQRVGIEKYYAYLNSLGLIEKSGIDFPGEAVPLVYPKSAIGPVELATMTYGQGGISITPVQLVTAIAAIANDGKLMKPRLVKALVDDDGNVVSEYSPNEVRQVVSEKTSQEMLKIMEFAVTTGSGKAAAVDGYKIGGKTGTADKVISGKYVDGKVFSSFIAVAPIEDPQIAVLFIVDEPVGVHFGSVVAAPYVKDILSETLRYLNIPPTSVSAEQKAIAGTLVKVPNVIKQEFVNAAENIESVGLLYKIMPEVSENEVIDNFIVVDQYPKAGEKVPSGTTIYLYKK